MSADRVSFFISHAGTDRAWAEWAAWQLEDAGYSVELDVLDWAAGQNFITKISDALDRADRAVALWSAEYFSRSRYTTEEWSAALADVPDEREGRLVPLRVEDVPAGKVPPILRPMLYRDLFGLAENEACRVLLEAIAGPARPGQPPAYPGWGTVGRLSSMGAENFPATTCVHPWRHCPCPAICWKSGASSGGGSTAPPTGTGGKGGR